MDPGPWNEQGNVEKGAASNKVIFFSPQGSHDGGIITQRPAEEDLVLILPRSKLWGKKRAILDNNDNIFLCIRYFSECFLYMNIYSPQ